MDVLSFFADSDVSSENIKFEHVKAQDSIYYSVQQ